jgi:hypothetical protein
MDSVNCGPRKGSRPSHFDAPPTFAAAASVFITPEPGMSLSGLNGDDQIQRPATKMHGVQGSSRAIVQPLTFYDNLALIKYLFRLLFRYLAPCSLYTMGLRSEGRE